MDNELTLPDISLTNGPNCDEESCSVSSIVSKASHMSLVGKEIAIKNKKKQLVISDSSESDESPIKTSNLKAAGKSGLSGRPNNSDSEEKYHDSSVNSEILQDSINESFVIKRTNKRFLIFDSEDESTSEKTSDKSALSGRPENRDSEEESTSNSSIIYDTSENSFNENIVLEKERQLVNSYSEKESTCKITSNKSDSKTSALSGRPENRDSEEESTSNSSIIYDTPQNSFNENIVLKKKKQFANSYSEKESTCKTTSNKSDSKINDTFIGSSSHEISAIEKFVTDDTKFNIISETSDSEVILSSANNSRLGHLNIQPVFKVRTDLFEKSKSPIIISSESNSEASSDNGCQGIIDINSDDNNGDPYLNKFILGRHGSSDSPITLSEGEGNYERRILPPPVVSPPKHFKGKTTQAIINNKSITPARHDQWRAEIIRLNSLKDEAMQKYIQLKNTQSSPSVKRLPDGGLKLLQSIKDCEKKVLEFGERIAFLNKKLKSTSVVSHQNVEKQKEPYMIPHPDNSHTQPSANFNVNDLGTRAIQTFQTQSSMIEDALKHLHSSLKTVQVVDEECETPKCFKINLLPHQMKGLTWMTRRESQKYPSGGILADDMGLGKTLSMIALIVQNKPHSNDQDSDTDDNDFQSHKYVKGGTLVIAPASVLSQWESEIKKRVSLGAVNYVLHHGSKRDDRPAKLARYDIVLTTYSIMQKENKENNYGPLLRINWNRIILDEAHTIRNTKSLTTKSILLLKGSRRWCLTGTPIQNKEADLFALIKFLKCRPFDDLNVWKRWVDNRDAAGQQRLNCIMKSIMLRRTKEEIESLNLKGKNISIVNVKLDDEEYAVYEKITLFSRALFAKFLTQKAEREFGGMPAININDKDKNPFSNHQELNDLYLKMKNITDVSTIQILVLLLRLRQICCHPSLIVKMLDDEELKDSEVVDNEGNDIDIVDRMMRMSIAPSCRTDEKVDFSQNNLSSSNPVFSASRISSKIRSVMLHLDDIIKSNDKVLIVSQFTSVLEIIKKLIEEKKIKYAFLSGKTPVLERGQMIENFNSNPRGAQVMLLSLQAGGTGLNLVGANHILFVDIHWNPQLERQAFDRVYRIGQKKDVYIYKFICEGTIEEYILKLQETKLAIADGVLTGTRNISSSKLTLNDLKTLFNVGV